MSHRDGVWDSLMKIPWDEQADAERVVIEKLGGTVRDDRDPGGGAEQVRDFHLETEQGGIAFEVTRHTNESHEATLTEVDKRKWRFPDLQFDWLIGTRLTYSVKQLHANIAALLTRVEATGVVYAHIVYDDDLPVALTADLIDALRAVGVKYFWRCDVADPTGGLVIPNVAGVGGTTSASLLIAAAVREANDPGNLKKLRNAIADERHLFIWIDHKQSAAAAAFGFGLPEDPPALPDGVDAVWCVETLQPARVWRYHREHGWRDLGRRPSAP